MYLFVSKLIDGFYKWKKFALANEQNFTNQVALDSLSQNKQKVKTEANSSFLETADFPSQRRQFSLEQQLLPFRQENIHTWPLDDELHRWQ